MQVFFPVFFSCWSLTLSTYIRTKLKCVMYVLDTQREAKTKAIVKKWIEYFVEWDVKWKKNEKFWNCRRFLLPNLFIDLAMNAESNGTYWDTNNKLTKKQKSGFTYSFLPFTGGNCRLWCKIKIFYSFKELN